MDLIRFGYFFNLSLRPAPYGFPYCVCILQNSLHYRLWSIHNMHSYTLYGILSPFWVLSTIYNSLFLILIDKSVIVLICANRENIRCLIIMGLYNLLHCFLLLYPWCINSSFDCVILYITLFCQRFQMFYVLIEFFITQFAFLIFFFF